MNPLLEKILKILDGIDKTEVETCRPGYEGAEGWWETSTGAEFGAERIKLIKDFVERFYNRSR